MKIFRLVQAALRLKCQHLLDLAGIGRGADRAQRSLAILVLDSRDHRLAPQSQRGQTLSIEPHTHTALGTVDIHRTHPRHAREHVLDVVVDIVRERQPVIRPVRRPQHQKTQHVRRARIHRNTLFGHLFRQSRYGLLYTVLNLNHVKVQIGANLKRHRQIVVAGVIAVRGHVKHVVHAVDLFLQRDCNCVGQIARAGTRIAGPNRYLRRRHLRVLRDRQRLDGQSPGEGQHNRDDQRESGAFNKDIGDHLPSASLADAIVTGLPGATFWTPRTTTRSPALTPERNATRPSGIMPEVTERRCTIPASSTT